MQKWLYSLCCLLICSAAFAEPDQELVYALKASVVKVHAFTKQGGHGVGSGVVVANNLVATNCHVIANATGINISKFGDSFAPVALRADWQHDVCLLRFEYLEMKPVELGDSEHLQYEQEIFTIGFSGGTPKPLTTSGRVKALYPMDDSVVVRTDSPFIMGASGSPVFDSQGKLVALSTLKSPGKHAYYYNIPVKWVKALLNAQEVSNMQTTEQPFWNTDETHWPFFMRVVPRYQNADWGDLKHIAAEWTQQQPQSIEAVFYRAAAEDGLGNTNKAQQLYEEVLSREPRHAGALMALGLLAQRGGQTAEVAQTHTALKAIHQDLDERFNEALAQQSSQ